MDLDDFRRKDLHKYYDKVKVCRLCKKKYGDNIKSKIRLCPICMVKLKGRKKLK